MIKRLIISNDEGRTGRHTNSKWGGKITFPDDISLEPRLPRNQEDLYCVQRQAASLMSDEWLRAYQEGFLDARSLITSGGEKETVLRAIEDELVSRTIFYSPNYLPK